jgi:hypothetical protein
MRTHRLLCLVLLVASFSAYAAAQNIQSDPDHQFTISVPLGWRVAKTEHGMKLSMSDSVIHIMHIDGQNTRQNAAQIAIMQSGENFTAMTPAENGDSILGGDPASYFNFKGYDDRAISIYLHVVASQSGWVFFAFSTEAGFPALRQTFYNIEKSFILTKNIPSAEPKPAQQ